MPREWPEGIFNGVFCTFFPSVSKLLDKSNNHHKGNKEIFMRLHHGNNVYMKRSTEELSAKLKLQSIA